MTGQQRQAVVAMYRATVPATLDWTPGPLPLTLGSLRTDKTARATYYPPRTVRLLYGSAGHPVRWHKEVKIQAGAATVTALEALRVDATSGILLVHLRPDTILPVLRCLAGRNPQALNEFDAGDVAPELEIASGHPYTLAFVTSPIELPQLYSSDRYPDWPAADQWLWALASRTDDDDYPPDLVEIRRQDDHFMRISGDWCGMVLRDGMALVGTRSDRGTDDDFYSHAAVYAQTIYADAITLGQLQLFGITALEEALAEASDSLDAPTMAGLERQLTFFRHRLWWQHLSTHGVPNQIIAAFHKQHHLAERFDQILAEISDFTRLARDDQARDINNSAVLFTVITVPVGIGLALMQLIGHASTGQFITVIAACLAFSLLVLLTRPGRIIIQSVRRKLM